MRICSRTGQLKRDRYRFRPTVHGSLASGVLEPRLLTSATLQRAAGFNAVLNADSNSYTYNPVNPAQGSGTGSGMDGILQQSVTAQSQAFGIWNDNAGNNLYQDTESSKASAKVSGPGTGMAGDNQPINSAQIQINVKHSGTDSFTNNTPNPVDPNNLIASGESSSTDTGADGDGGFNSLVYTTGGGTNGKETITATFQATISATGLNGKFTVGASLSLNSTYLNVTIGTNGASATGFNTAPKQDANFENVLPYSDSFTYTVTAPNVPDGTALGISYSSQLTTQLGAPRQQAVGGPPAPDPRLFPGVTTNDASFNWSLTYTVS